MNYFLIGMMGSGKTSLGKSLANDIDCNFIDLDGEIEKTAGIKINNIFDKYGEKYFRKLEMETSRKVIKNSENNVIATGGGFPINENNFKWMKNIGIIIWLKASAETIFKRIRSSKDRPLLTNPSIQSIEGILSERMKYYQRAKYHIDTNGKSLNMTVNTLIKEIKSNNL